MKNIYKCIICIFTLALLAGVFHRPISEKFMKALDSNPLIVQESVRYYEMEETTGEMTEISSKDEYEQKVASEISFRQAVKEISQGNGKIIMTEIFNEFQSGDEVDVNGAVVPPSLDTPPYVSLNGVSNGGVTVNPVTVTYDYFYSQPTTNKGAQYKIGSDSEFVNFTSGTVFTTHGTYLIKVWNPIGETQMTFTILSTGEEVYSGVCHMRVLTSVKYRNSENSAIMSTKVYWDTLPENIYRRKNILTISCRDNDWIYDIEEGALLSYEFNYTDTYYRGYGDFNDVILDQQILSTIHSIDISSTVQREVLVSTDPVNDQLMFSIDSPLPCDTNGYSTEVTEWMTREYNALEYELEVNVKLRQHNETIGEYAYFPEIEESGTLKKYIDIVSYCTFGINEDYFEGFQFFCKVIGLTLSLVSFGISSITINLISLVLSAGSFVGDYIFGCYVEDNTFIVPCYCYNMIE